MNKFLAVLPLFLLLLGVALVSVGVFLFSVPVGFIVTGLLLALLAYMVSPKGGEQ
ncbi:hypothetical protein [Weissella confusa]|uniref:hypothetical protein n=1 Tax=Weissella confusa TaxID=1583 RepID=UPI001897D7D0|nr:hypothetical protein [Weissella confusa]